MGVTYWGIPCRQRVLPNGFLAYLVLGTYTHVGSVTSSLVVTELKAYRNQNNEWYRSLITCPCQDWLVSNLHHCADYRPLNAELEVTIAERMGKDWERIGLRLGIENWELENIRADHRTQFGRACQVLQKWKHHRGDDMRPKDLYSTLRRCGRNDLAGSLLILV